MRKKRLVAKTVSDTGAKKNDKFKPGLDGGLYGTGSYADLDLPKVHEIVYTNAPVGTALPMNYDQQVAIKHDTDKLRYSLIPSKPIANLAEVLMFGAKKYGDYNWTGGFKWTRLYDATQRHLHAWISGETLDPESGMNHLAHAMCNIVFLLEFEKTQKELDDRHVK